MFQEKVLISRCWRLNTLLKHRVLGFFLSKGKIFCGLHSRLLMKLFSRNLGKDSAFDPLYWLCLLSVGKIRSPGMDCLVVMHIVARVLTES